MITLFILLFLPFIPWIIGGIIVFFVTVTLISVFSDNNHPQVGVLGPNATGKTLFFSELRGIWTDAKSDYIETTAPDEIKEIKYNLSNGKSITLRNCIDLPGTASFIRSHYQKITLESTYIFFFCNMCKYLSDVDYERNVNARLDYIFQTAKSKKTPIRTCLILSYADMVDNPNEARKQVQEKLSNKDYASFYEQKVTINMTDQKAVKELINKLFS